MNMKPLRNAIAGIIAGIVIGAAPALAQDQPPVWNHNPADADRGSEVWGNIAETFETCGGTWADLPGGDRQSPINVIPRATIPALLPPLVFDYHHTAFKVENTGHVIEVPYGEGSVLWIGTEKYRLVQFHFHAPSEHEIRGKSFAMEAHLVHMNSSGQLAVVGVLLKEADAGNPLVDDIFAVAPDEESEIEVDGVSVDATDLLPLPNRRPATRPRLPRVVKNYYTYAGSLTTPPCSEGVRWFVLSEPMEVSHEAVERLHEIVSQFPNYDGFPDNNRPVQALNGRQVYQRRGF